MKTYRKYFNPFLLITILFSSISYLSFSQNLSKEQTLSYINSKWTKYGIYTKAQPIILNGDVIVHRRNKYVINEGFRVEYIAIDSGGTESYYVYFYDKNKMTGRMPFLSAEECQSVVKSFNHLKSIVLSEKSSKKDPFK